MKRPSYTPLKMLALALVIFLASCKVPKSYFTVEIRNKVEAKSISVTKLQFYVDRDVELRRELSSGDMKVSSGKVKFENGKYIHIILLKKYTPGVCTKVNDRSLDISFEVGDGKFLAFGVAIDAPGNTVYQIFAQEWVKQGIAGNAGKVTYDGNTYYIQPAGSMAQLMIKKSVIDKLEVKKRTMKGRKL